MSTKRLSKNQSALIPTVSAKKSLNPRLKIILHSLSLLAALALAIVSWGYRLFDVGTIIGNGGMGDLVAYYNAGKSLLAHQPIWVIGESAPFGPPLTLIPFLPLLKFPLVLAQFIFSLLNVLSYVLVWHVISRLCIQKFSLKNSFWWAGLAVMAWSFPISYSLGSGNPMGIVTWGIYGYLLSTSLFASMGLVLAISLKLFPAVLVPLISQKRKDVIKASVVASMSVILALLSILLWPSQWRAYSSYASHLSRLIVSHSEISLQNQSVGSMLDRLGVNASWNTTFVIGWSVGLLLLVGLWMATEKPWKKLTLDIRLRWGMRLLTMVLLLHPTPWQYYHALFIPYILLQLAQKRFAYLPVLLLLSFNGGWLPPSFPGMSLLASSQWLGLLLLIVVEFSQSKKTSINQIIKDRSFFNQVSA